MEFIDTYGGCRIKDLGNLQCAMCGCELHISQRRSSMCQECIEYEIFMEQVKAEDYDKELQSIQDQELERTYWHRGYYDG